MNVLSNNTGLSQQMLGSIQKVKNLMLMAKGNPMAVLQQNPQMQQVVQMCRGQNPKIVFENMCRQMGINPNDIINALKG